ncbi:hypothetical protein [Roseateles sp. LYH14W]|uniref:Uncharacterized protein n=1 Tax=Pelomonas parva TaxID=3299032 RepID=A0ABW7EX90_9BURK
MKKTWAHGLAALALGCGLVVPAAAAQDDPAPVEAAKGVVAGWVDDEFKLPADLKLDAPLREQLVALASAHRERVAALAAGWVAEELQHVNVAKEAWVLSRNLLARYMNESAIWQLDSTGDAHDELMLRAVRRAGTCQAVDGKRSFGALAAMLQGMSAADRELALAAQQQMLARWGQVRAIPVRPVPSLLEQGQAVMAKLRAPKPVEGEPAVPPVLAFNLLATPPKAMAPDLRCALVRWTLSREQFAKTAAATQMTLARYALLVDAVALFRPGMDAAADERGYSPVAARFAVDGDVTAVGRLRASGLGLDEARIDKRQVDVPGVRGVRAVAFETVFDEVTLDRVAKTKTPPGQGEWTEAPFTWKIK